MKEIDGKGEEVMNELENNKIKLYGFNNLTKIIINNTIFNKIKK